MSQESRSSSEHQMHSNICFSCGEVIVGRVYSVQRRRIRDVSRDEPSPLTTDAIDPLHGGVILGPEFDVDCIACYANLPDVQELIDAHKERVNSDSKNLD